MLAAILDEWREDLRYRVSRVKARLKFMIDDIGPEGMRALVEARLGRQFDDFELPQAPPPDNHLGVHEQKDGLSLDRRAGAPRARHRRPDDRDRRARSRVSHHAPAELRAHRRRRCRTGRAAARRDRVAARCRRAARRCGRLHGRAALQLLGDRDEVADGRSRAGARAALRADDRRPAAASRRLPARLRASLGRRSRLPGHDRARRRGQAPPGLRRVPARQPRPAAAIARPGVPARPDRGARRCCRSASWPAGSTPAQTTSRSGRSATARPTTTRAAGREPASPTKGGSMSASICSTIWRPAS